MKREECSSLTGTIRPEIEALTPEVVAWRRQFHQIPELGFQEEKTARLVAEALNKIGLSPATGIAGTGIVAVLEGAAADQDSKTLLLRSDMDALPVQEQSEAPYRSTHSGRMHACGHDAHMAILLGVARYWWAHRDRLAGRLKFVFQPAEEGPGGAEPMIAAGVLENPSVDAAVGLHVWGELPVGSAALVEGPFMASANKIRITVRGSGGHGAMPHRSVDPIVAAAQIIMALQTVASRNTNPLEAVVVSIGAIHGGDAFNVIPDTVDLAGTVRTFSLEARERIRDQITRIAQGVARGLGAEAEVAFEFGYPPLINDPGMTALVGETLNGLLGPGRIHPTQTMGGEDMAYFLQRVPGCFYFLGAANQARGMTAPNHSPFFDVDEAVLPLGVESLVRVAERYFAGRA